MKSQVDVMGFYSLFFNGAGRATGSFETASIPRRGCIVLRQPHIDKYLQFSHLRLSIMRLSLMSDVCRALAAYHLNMFSAVS